MNPSTEHEHISGGMLDAPTVRFTTSSAHYSLSDMLIECRMRLDMIFKVRHEHID